MDFDRYREERPVDWLSGAFLIARREAVAEVGPLDERFFLYSEEIDWCYRIRAAGWEVRHLPVMEVVHHCGDSGAPQLVAELSHSRMLLRLQALRPGPRASASARALALKHVLRLTVMAAAAVVRPALRRRLRAEASRPRRAGWGSRSRRV